MNASTTRLFGRVRNRGLRRSARAPSEPLEQRLLFAAGDLDPTFGTNGLAYASLGALAAADVALAPDGKVVVVASTWGRYDESVTLGRLHADGAADLSFGRFQSGDAGLPVIIPPDDAGVLDGRWASGLAVQPDRKVLVAGGAYDEGFDFVLDQPFTRRAGFIVRLREDGLPDPAFGGGDGIATGPEGIVAIPDVGTWTDGAFPFIGLALLPDGRIVSARAGSLHRFNPDGTPDTTFGGDGSVELPLPPGLQVFSPLDLALVPDGSGDVAVTGRLQTAEGRLVVIARVRPDGTPAAAFGGGDGVVLESVKDDLPPDMGSRMGIGPDGAVVLSGSYRLADQQWLAVIRFTSAGDLDTAFGRGGPDGDGVVTAGTPGDGRSANDVAVLPDGRVIAVGNAGSIFSVVRFTADGLVDGTFAPGGRDGDGIATVEFPPDEPNPNPDESHSRTPAHAVAVQPDGKVIAAAGDAWSDGWSSHGNVILARFLADPPPEGASTYQAEQAAISGAAVSRAHSGYAGTGYVDYVHASGDYADFTVTAPAAGPYELAFRYAHGGISTRRMDLRVAGQAVPGGVAFVPTGSWRTWNDRAVTVQLAAGSNAVRLAASGQSGPNVDAVTVTPVTPPATPYQAESARQSGAAAAATHGGYTGTGYADYAHASGDFVEFSVDVPADGTYLLGFRYANGGSYDRPLDLSVDGQTIVRLSFAPTGSWRTWKIVTMPVVISAGRHTVRLTATGRSGPNLDSLALRAA